MATTKTMWSLLLRPFKASFLALLLCALTLLNSHPAIASRNGTPVPDNTFAVGYTYESSGISKICSGALLSPTVIATAAHCVIDAFGNASTNYIFSSPGVALDAPINPGVIQPKVLKVYTTPGYVPSDSKDQEDIAFIQLDLPLATKGFIRVATAAELTSLAAKTPLTGYGFGDVFENGADYSPFARSFPLIWNLAKQGNNTLEITSSSASACLGDSGGPITAKLSSGEEVLVAVLDSAADVYNHCGSPTNGIYTMKATSALPYMNLIAEALKSSAPIATPKPVVKLYKITCVKLKVKKYLTGTNPKCPTGYKQTAKVSVRG